MTLHPMEYTQKTNYMQINKGDYTKAILKILNSECVWQWVGYSKYRSEENMQINVTKLVSFAHKTVAMYLKDQSPMNSNPCCHSQTCN